MSLKNSQMSKIYGTCITYVQASIPLLFSNVLTVGR